MSLEENEKTVSDCCHAEVRHINNEGPMCTACGEREVELTWEPCPEGVCDGSGLVGVFTSPEPGLPAVPDGEEECICRKSEPEPYED